MASTTDKITRTTDSDTGRPVIAQLVSPGKAVGATSISVNDLTNWTTVTKVHFAIYNTTQAGGKTIKDTTTQSEWVGTVSGTTISNLSLTGGNDQSYLAGAYAEVTPTAKYAKDLYDGLVTNGIHNADGTLKDGSISATSKLADSIVTNSKIASGVTTDKLSNPYKFSVYQNGDITINANSWTKAQLNTELFDTGNVFDSSTNFRFTAPVSGYYQINAQIAMSISGYSSTTSSRGAIFKNGSAYLYSSEVPGTGDTRSQPKHVLGQLMYLAANDYLELNGIIYESSRQIGGGMGSTFMTGYLVSIT